LLRACGSHTLCAIRDSHGELVHPTAIHQDGGKGKSESMCWLSDGEFLYPLQLGVNTLGRSSDNDVVLEDAYASRRHCAIVVHSTEAAEIHDTASKNGTYLNGQRLVGPAYLKGGDEIRISERAFHFFTRADEPNALSPEATLDC
jgi:pSer/pThr/pTyr-binding forkhead associated (FHA) protein